MAYEGKKYEATTVRTEKGLAFSVDVYDGWAFLVFRDVRRNYAEVAAVDVPMRYRDDTKLRDAYIKKVARLIVSNYIAQHKRKHNGLLFLPAATLSKDELKNNVGLVRAVRSDAAPVEQQKPARGREERPEKKKKKRLEL